ncbi:MAG TPA: hypothetical protein VNG89_27230 [Vicinamibacterales bacterium]|nr:hypothetical protein [Vicinamibacterales bacterium]
MNDRSPIPDILLERYRLGELPSEDATTIADRIRRDPALAERIATLERSDRELRGDGVTAAIAAQLRDRLAVRGADSLRRRRSAWWLAVPAAAAAVAAVALAIAARPASPPVVPQPDRIKGLQPALAIYRHTAAGSETLADGAIARPGDLLRVGYRAAGRAYGVILSVDGNHTVTMHLPAAGDRAAPLAHQPTVLLDQAYELDAAPLWERFYFVAGDAPFDVRPIVAAARAAPSLLALPRELDQAIFSLQKEARP